MRTQLFGEAKPKTLAMIAEVGTILTPRKYLGGATIQSDKERSMILTNRCA